MSKYLVETKGDFMLMCRGGTIEPFRPSVVAPCGQVDEFVSEKKIKILNDELPDSATDEGFAEFYFAHEKDSDAALENYLAKLEAGEAGDSDDEGAAEAKAAEAAKVAEAEKAEAEKAEAEKAAEKPKPATKTTTAKTTKA